MGHMKDFDRRIRQGGDDAVAAVSEYVKELEGEVASARACAEMMLQGTGQKLGEELARRVMDEHYPPLWIPVSERLPDRNVNVLVFIPAAAEKTYIASLDEGGMWFSSDPTADGYSLGEDGAPTHWMPLPEPPEVK